MALFPARLRMLVAVLFNRPLRVRFGPAGEAFFYPSPCVVLPVIQGGAPEGDEDGDDGDGDGDDDAGSDDGDGADSDDDDDGDDGADDGKEKDADYYRKQLRRYERTTKRKRERDKKELKETQDKLKEREDEDKSEQEKAVEKAKEEGRTEALTEAQKERRSDRLESACVRQAAKKIEIGEGDDKKRIRFEDPEDAEVFLQRKIAKGDIDEADLFDDDGKVKTDVLAEALQEILEEKPRLAEDPGSDGGKKKEAPEGSADGGKGKDSADDEGSVEGEFKKIRRHEKD